MRRFELSDGTSDKFWQVGQDGCQVNVHYGRIGSAGTTQNKRHADAAKAAAAMDKLIREKTAKGYAEVAPGKSRTPTQAVAETVAQAAAETVTQAAAERVAQAVAETVAQAGTAAPWLRACPPIALPRGLAGRALASRRFPGAPPNPDAAACWALFRTHARRYAEVDPDNSPASWRDAVIEALARIGAGPASGSARSDLVLLAISTLFEERLAADDGAPFLDFLVAHNGLPYALQVVIDMEGVSIAEVNNQYGMCWYMRDEGIGSFSPSNEDFGRTELALRAHLAHAPQALWEQCAATIRAALPALPVRRQPLFGVLLPELPALSDALALALAPQAIDTAAWLRLSASDPAALAALDPLKPSSGYYANPMFYNLPAAVATLVQERGSGAVDLLKDGAGFDASGDALAHIGTPEAMRALALACEASKKSLKRLATAARRWPHAALAALAELAAARQAPAPAAAVLADLVLDHGAEAAAVKPWISAPAAAVLDAIGARAAAPADMADLAELPAVLANPPWLAPPRAQAKVLALAPLPLAPLLRWSEDERQELLKEKRYNAWPYNWKRYPGPADAPAAIAAGDLAKVVALWEAYAVGGYEIGGSVHAIADMPAPFNAAVWSAMSGHEINSPGYAIATLGLAGLAALTTMCERRPADELAYARHFGAVELAAPLARAYATLKSKPPRELARAWLLANPEHAACGLIAPALGKAGGARDAAAHALRLLADAGHAALLVEVACRYRQGEVDAALRALLDEDPLARIPARIGPLPAFWMPRNWTRPRLAGNGKALPDAALDPIGVMLRFPYADGVYPGIEQLRQACSASSLAGFAWDLFCAWTDAGADPKENWAFAALRLFGNDDSARKLTPLIRAWPGQSQHQRAIFGLDVLCAIGSDTALMLLAGVAQKVRFKALQDTAREKIAELAEARGLASDELEDRLVPDLGLDPDGTLLLDFGPRQFRIGFDETLKPYVRDADGAPGRPAQAEQDRRPGPVRRGAGALQAAQEGCAHHRGAAGTAPGAGHVRTAALAAAGLLQLTRGPCAGASSGAAAGVGRLRIGPRRGAAGLLSRGAGRRADRRRRRRLRCAARGADRHPACARDTRCRRRRVRPAVGRLRAAATVCPDRARHLRPRRRGSASRRARAGALGWGNGRDRPRTRPGRQRLAPWRGAGRRLDRDVLQAAGRRPPAGTAARPRPDRRHAGTRSGTALAGSAPHGPARRQRKRLLLPDGHAGPDRRQRIDTRHTTGVRLSADTFLPP
jgi:predicted DNA-binding WGR domain protein